MSKVTVVSLTTTGNSAPTVIADGVQIRRGGAVANEGFSLNVDECEVLVEAVVSAATAGTITYIRMWGWFPDATHATNKWFPLGGGPAADKGKLNADASTAYLFAETASDLIRHAERLRGIRECTRVFAECNTLTNITSLIVTLSSAGGLMSI